jgi:hypothetical protein
MPETTIGTASPARLSRPATSVPSRPAPRWICCSRANTGATESSPTSSVIQAWVAPEVKVEPIPQTTWAAKTVTSSGTACSSMPIPTSTQPISTEVRRLCRSATIPVGTSKSRQVTSSTVPTSTSWNGVRPTTVAMKTRLTVKLSVKQKVETAVST